MADMTKFDWNEYHDEKLQNLLNEGASASEAAKALVDQNGNSPTRNAVIGRCHRRGYEFQYKFTTKPTGRKPMPVRAKMPKDPQPRKIAPALKLPKPIPTYTAPSGNGVPRDQHASDQCSCLLDNGNVCNGIRQPKSAWCSYHREKFTQPRPVRQVTWRR